MNIKPLIKISVRDLVEHVLKAGDIYVGYFQRSRSVEGIRGHQKVQKKRGTNYQKEVSVAYQIEKKNCFLILRGRIDGVLQQQGITIIEEIKTTTRTLNSFLVPDSIHLAQAKCYAYVYAKQENLKEISIQITYYNIDTRKTRIFKEKASISNLEGFVHELVDEYLEWAMTLYNWSKVRDKSILGLEFPFDSYRAGQEKMIKVVEETLEKRKRLFIQAPTGIGKTIAALYPAIKAKKNDELSRIFYLTAKTTTKEIAENTFKILHESGLRYKVVTITAKAKTCFKEKDVCDPNYCEYAKGHFNRINNALKDIFKEDDFTRTTIENYAKKHMVCPFEFSLDLALFSDCIICDYNYAFDPRVFLRRFFAEEKGDYIFLIDEAHNLVDRAREMFSAELSKKEVLKLRRDTKERVPLLSKNLNEMNKLMINYRKKCEENNKKFFVKETLPRKEFITHLRKFSYLAEEWLEMNIKAPFTEELLDFYFSVRNFLRVVEDYDDKFVTYFEKHRNDLKVKLFCLDPSYLLDQALNRGNSAVFYSATLTPLEYFAEILGGGQTASKMQLPSPFPEDNLCLLLDDTISTKYMQREYSYERITKLIQSLVKGKTGNYLIYFPSYEYMEEIYERFNTLNSSYQIIKQEIGMSEIERTEFLERFSNYGDKTLVGFAVMGGVFGEGIDLTGEKLSGAVVVGVGLPKICLEQELIRRYFDEVKNQGFHYAYTFPGMNKVLQAVGRVIRTKEDRGVVLLVDERFSSWIYQQLYPQHWKNIIQVFNEKSIENKIEQFWEQ